MVRCIIHIQILLEINLQSSPFWLCYAASELLLCKQSPLPSDIPQSTIFLTNTKADILTPQPTYLLPYLTNPLCSPILRCIYSVYVPTHCTRRELCHYTSIVTERKRGEGEFVEWDSEHYHLTAGSVDTRSNGVVLWHCGACLCGVEEYAVSIL